MGHGSTQGDALGDDETDADEVGEGVGDVGGVPDPDDPAASACACWTSSCAFASSS